MNPEPVGTMMAMAFAVAVLCLALLLYAMHIADYWKTRALEAESVIRYVGFDIDAELHRIRLRHGQQERPENPRVAPSGGRDTEHVIHFERKFKHQH